MGRGSNDLSLRVILSAQDKASGALRGFGSTLVNLAGAKGPLLGAMLAISAAAIGIGVTAVSSAADFQQAMLSNVAHAGLAKSQFDSVSNAVLNMAGEVGRSPTQLAEALYPILSAFSGITNQSAKSALALDTLRMSFEAVAGTSVNGTAVANAAVGTFNALGLATNNAGVNAKRMANLFDVMDLTVQQGNMTWDAYKNVISKLAVSISGTSVKFNEASAALATLTNEGMSAQKAQTYLSNMFTTMIIKTDAMAKHAAKLHIAFKEQAYSSMDLAHKIAYLNEITGGNKQKLLALLGGNATALKSFNALSVGLGNYKTNLQALNHAHGALKSSFETASQGFNFAMSKAKAAIDALLIRIGTGLLPILTKIVGAVAPAVQWLLNFASAVSKNEVAMAFIKGALVGFVVVLLAILIPAFYAWAVAAGAAALATLAATWPILLIGAIVAVVVAGIILAVQHWGQIMDWISGKAEQTRIKIELEHSKMAVKTDEQTMKAANKAIANYEKQRKGILQKLKETHDPAERAELEHQLKMLNIQEDAQKKKLAKAEADKKAQLEKQKELHAQYLEAQKNWFVRLLDSLNAWVGDQWKKLTSMVGGWMTALGHLKDRGWAKLQEIGNSIKDFFTSLPGKLLKWGEDMIAGFIQGIKNKLGDIGNAVGNIGKTIQNFLHFSKPDTGPLSNADTWMPDMMDLMIKGIIAGNPKLLAAVQMTSKTVAGVGAPPARSIPYGRPPLSSNSYSNVAGGGNHYGNNTFVISGSSNPDTIARAVEQRLNQKFRRSGVMGNSSLGARNS